jgi:hypothetical protein
MLPIRPREFSNIDQQIVSKNSAISVCLITSKDLAMLEAKLLRIKMMLSDAGDVMLTTSSQRQENTCYRLVWATLKTIASSAIVDL